MKTNAEVNILKNRTSNVHNIWEGMFFLQNQHISETAPHEPIIFFVIRGSIRLSINDQENYTVFQQEMFIVSDNDAYRIKTLEQVSLISCRIPIESLFSEQILIDELMQQDGNDLEKCLKLPIKKNIVRYLTLLSNCLRDGLDSICFFELKRRELFLLLSAYYTKRELSGFMQSLLSRNLQFKKFVLNNYLAANNVRELAALANYSTSGFIKKFQKYFDESPYKWMQKQKAKRILIEINEGVKSLQEIANEYKFSSYQHFAVFCKNLLGLPPSEIYKKNVLKKNL